MSEGDREIARDKAVIVTIPSGSACAGRFKIQEVWGWGLGRRRGAD